MAQKAEAGKSADVPSPPSPRPVVAPCLVLDPPTVEGLATYIQAKDCRRILIMLGAGISVAAGIPDFRTPGTGLYANLGKYNLAQPEEVFSLDLLKQRPEVFYTVANDMQLWPGLFAPTHVHQLVKLLCDEGRVLRVCTQNIDTLERQTGVGDGLIVEAHGSFAAAHCIEEKCRAAFPVDELRAIAAKGQVPRCATCGTGVVKPDVVFFGEGLPAKFFNVWKDDAPTADLLIVIGTSLKVQPFASLVSQVPKSIPRVLINNMRAGGTDFLFAQDADANEAAKTKARIEAKKKTRTEKKQQGGAGSSSSSDSDDEIITAIDDAMRQIAVTKNGVFRDVFLEGDCQQIAQQLAKGLGLAQRLTKAYDAGKQAVTAGKAAGKKAEPGKAKAQTSPRGAKGSL